MRRKSFTSAFFVVFSVSAVAQNIPDAGSLMRQTEQNIRFNEMQRSVQIRDALPPEAEFTDKTSVVAKRFKFNGNSRLTEDRLQAAVNPFANRPLNQNDLQHLTDAVTETYRQSGWMVDAYIPRQDLSARELTIQVIENISSHKPKR
jgi:hemolysin activation/secretion protein